MTNKRPLQITLWVASAFVILTGLLDLLGGTEGLRTLDAVLPAAYPTIDTQVRFLGAIWLGLGVTLARIIPNIENQTMLFRLMMGSIFLGGVGRVLSLITLGAPPPFFIGLMLLELLGAPALIFWQSRVAKST
jgi:hypothetical protein